jgi:hypothetical protein
MVTFGAGWLLANAWARAGDGSAPVSARNNSPSQQPGTNPAPTNPAPTNPATMPTVGSGSFQERSQPSQQAPLPALSKASRAPIKAFNCPGATVPVATAQQLTAALAVARPGAVIVLADGFYQGEFASTRSGTAKRPIYLCGSRRAVLDGGGLKGGYTLHLNGASYWRVKGFTVQDGQKGVMLDGVTGVGLQGLLVQQIGDEAVHLRKDSTVNVVRGLTIRRTGLRKDKFGEGVYVGTAVSNWCQVSNCQADHSDGNFILANVISATTAEAIDLKEGTSSGVVADNHFDGTDITGADSWVDVKGNGWLIAGNRGRRAPVDGYQVHEILDGWGYRNLFSANISAVDADGYAFKVTKTHSGNVVRCNNRVTAAGKGLSNITCS